jgi:hypothetical protein
VTSPSTNGAGNGLQSEAPISLMVTDTYSVRDGATAPSGLPFTPSTPTPIPSPAPIPLPSPAGLTESGSGPAGHDGALSPGGFIGERAPAWRVLDFMGRLPLNDDRLVTRPVTITVPPG